ncbi:riboflavin synthase [Chloroflexus sp. MS-CIW-1]|jgi:riboflavin synthase|uniref:riboflavin synthase n=1 Tax=Chloroflexus sp. MS-CIW-1 TaxID=3055768 RepID=UPI001B2C24D0|nr:riboflavin synthase [Chloroflexus sp. MS-CIW-1]MBO9347199.1 riboflavin synthase [Chloroflexus sp.]MDN5273550.1 riboflavin synthase [Chloroflexus sp. MS-CIW-1]
MFTGIVEEMGTVAHIVGDQDQANQLTVNCHTVLEGTRIGDSIAVNGTCLTVTALTNHSFTVGLSPETLRRTNLGLLKVGDPVNLERALAFGGRMGGHYVQGHVDGIGEIVAIVPEGDSKRVTIRPPARLLPYIVEKGYIAVDGVSLTVAEMGRDTFTVALVAYTQSAVIMGHQQVGALVNIEVDIIAKYVERLVEAYRREAH